MAGKTVKGSGGREAAVDETMPAGPEYDDGFIFEEEELMEDL